MLVDRFGLQRLRHLGEQVVLDVGTGTGGEQLGEPLPGLGVRPLHVGLAVLVGSLLVELGDEQARGADNGRLATRFECCPQREPDLGRVDLLAQVLAQALAFGLGQLGGQAATTVGGDLSLLHAIFATAQREELVESNPAANAERPEAAAVSAADPGAARSRKGRQGVHRRAGRTVFLTLVLTGLRRSEVQRLRWRDVDLVENVLRVRDSKTEDGIRSIALTRTLVDVLTAHLGRSAFQGADELVFCHPERGTTYRPETFKEALNAALAAAGVNKQPRAFHDLRHTAITNDAAAGSSPIAVMTKAGHSDMATTKRYLHLAGVVFRDEADALERRLGLCTEPSTRPSAPERTSEDLRFASGAVQASAE
jgi:integrase